MTRALWQAYVGPVQAKAVPCMGLGSVTCACGTAVKPTGIRAGTGDDMTRHDT